MGAYKEITVTNGQSLIDICLQEYGCVESLFMLQSDNPVALPAMTSYAAPGTKLRIRKTVPVITDDNQAIVAQYVRDNRMVTSGIKEPVQEYEVSAYAFGHSDIVVSSRGGDSWSAAFSYHPTIVLASGSLVGMNCFGFLVNGGTQVSGSAFFSFGLTADTTINFDGYGAGIWLIRCNYFFNDEVSLGISRYVQVDGSGNIIRQIASKGFEEVYLDGMLLTATGLYETSGFTEIEDSAIQKSIAASTDTDGVILSDTVTVIDGLIPANTVEIDFIAILGTGVMPDLPDNPPYSFSFAIAQVIISPIINS